MNSRFQRVCIFLLLIFGAVLMLRVVNDPRDVMHSPSAIILVAIAAVAALVPGVRKYLAAEMETIRHPSPRARWIIAMGVTVFACGYLILTAMGQWRDFFPKLHDELQFLVQARMLAQGRLWMPQHPLADFFETSYVLVKPVYAAQSFPGAAMMLVPGIWLHLPYWMMPLLIAGTCVGLLYRIVAEVLDGAYGLLAAILLLSLNYFRQLSIMPMAHEPVLLLGLLAWWGYLRWRVNRGVGWALLIGICAGWAAITRPVDAIALMLPLGLIMILDLYRQPIAKIAATILLLIIGAAPLLSLQLYFNHGVTGHWLDTPFSFYNKQFYPDLVFGFNSLDPAHSPQTQLPQKIRMYDEFIAPRIREHSTEGYFQQLNNYYLPKAMRWLVPHPMLYLLFGIGLFGLTRRERWILFAPLPLFLFLYTFYPLFLEHYTPPIMPAAILTILLGIKVIQDSWPKRLWLQPALVLLVVAMALSNTSEFNNDMTLDAMNQPTPVVSDHSLDARLLRYIHREMYKVVKPPAIVLFQYGPSCNKDVEPVYNWDVAWPDDASIIRVQDLGPEQNARLARYYAEKQPGRMFYSLNEQTGQITPIGTARDIAASLAPSAGK